MDKISVTMTHCRRLSELDITLNSFLATNEYPIDEFIIIDDSNDSNISDVLIKKYSKKVIHILHNVNTQRFVYPYGFYFRPYLTYIFDILL